MAYTRTWNTAYEGIPQNSEDARFGAQRIRELKVDIRERFEKEHGDMDTEGGGRHRFPLVTVGARDALVPELVDGALVFRTDLNAIQVYDSSLGANPWHTYYGAFVGETKMFQGHVNDIPKGWKLSDGGTYNSFVTADLREKFIVGTKPGGGGDYDTTDPVATPKTGGQAGFVVEEANIEQFTATTTTGLAGQGSPRVGTGGTEGSGNVHPNNTNAHDHTHDVAIGTIGATEIDNRPPYYALAFIVYVGLAVAD